jgi:DUF4097 and DUF4098 domain-containing protein YvlB
MKREHFINSALLVAFCGSILLPLVSGTARAATEEQINKKFSVKPGGTVVVDIDVGGIEVGTNATSEVLVDVWRKVGRSSKSAEEKFLKDNPVNFTQDGDTVTISAKSKGKNGWSWTGRNSNEAKYKITVPAKFNAKLETAGGGIEVGDLTGDVKSHTSGGALHFARLHGPLNGETSGGGIHVKDCEGKLKINTSGGGIDVAGGSGSLDGDTSGGSVSVKEFKGPMHVETSGGGITIYGATAKVVGSTSGGSINAVLVKPVSDEVKLETSGGGITLRVAGDAAFNLDAETSAGNVRSELPVVSVGKRENDRLKGPVNGGGKTVWLRSSAGSIHVKSVDGIELESKSR